MAEINLNKKLEAVARVSEHPMRNAKLLGKGGISLIGSIIGMVVLFAAVNILFFVGAVVKLAVLGKYDTQTIAGLLTMILVGIVFCSVVGFLSYKQALKKLLRHVYRDSKELVNRLLDIIAEQVWQSKATKPHESLQSTNFAAVVSNKIPNMSSMARKGLFKLLHLIPLVRWIEDYGKNMPVYDQQSLKLHLQQKTDQIVLNQLLYVSNTLFYVCMVANLLIQAVLFYMIF